MKTKNMVTAATLVLCLATVPAAMAKQGKWKGHEKGHGRMSSEAPAQSGGWNDRQRADQQFARFDRNRDGVITRDEFAGDPTLFERLDLNRDGALTRGEIAQALPDRGAVERQLRSYDRNGDGIITRNEFPGDAATFDHLDRNRDGVLSQADHNGATDRNDRQMRFRGMDSNGDGVITRAEWRGNDKSFSKHDRNGDGVLSGDELLGRGKDSDHADRKHEDRDRDDD